VEEVIAVAIKIVVCGPPHSGKSVFVSLLRGLLPRDQFLLVEGAPDGEGVTGWFHEGDPALSRAIRRKGRFTSEFVDWVCSSVRNSTARITIVDVGGRRSPENEKIFLVCTHFIVVSADQEETVLWTEFGERLGLEPIAILDSVLEGEDEIYEEGYPLRARITRLERDNPPFGSLTARRVAQRILELAAGEREPGFDGSERAHVNFPALAEELNLPLRNGGPDRDWFPGILPELLRVVKARCKGLPEVRLWGNCSAGFPYHTLACNLEARVRYYDPKVPGYVPLPELQLGEGGDQLLDWRVEERDGYSLVEFTIPGQVFDVFDLPLVEPPAIPTHKGVVVSGKAPWWLTGAICRAYHRAGVRWVAVFTPQESCRRDPEGKKWSERYPGLAPAVVVGSHDPTVRVGTVIPFRL